MEKKVKYNNRFKRKKTVFIQDILFKGRQNIEWAEVKIYKEIYWRIY